MFSIELVGKKSPMKLIKVAMTKTKKVMQSNFSKSQNGYTTRLHISDFVKEKTECIIASSNNWSSTENS